MYFNENDQYVAQWLDNLFPEALIDDRSIADVQAADLVGFTRCHFFGGVGGWEFALNLAGWPAGREVWTGSCPCQPFSVAGEGKGEADERHLWPEFRRLIAKCRPPEVFGEQVASNDGREWLARVRADLEGLGYVVGAADLCSASQAAPHIRQRLFWYAKRLPDTGCGSPRRGPQAGRGTETHGAEGQGETPGEPSGRGDSGWLAHPGHEAGSAEQQQQLHWSGRTGEPGVAGGLFDAVEQGLEGHTGDGDGGREPGRIGTTKGRPACKTGAWSDYDIIGFRDGKRRRIKSGLECLAYGVPARTAPLRTRLLELGVDAATARRIIALAKRYRVGSLRGIGNAISPQVAAVFIRACMALEDCE